METRITVEDSGILYIDPTVEKALAAGGIGIWRWRIGSTELEWSRNLEAIHLMAPGTFDGTFESFAADIDPRDVGVVMETINRAVESGQPYEIRYRNRPPSGIDPIWIEARGRIEEAEDGRRYLLGVCQNATERITGQLQLERRLLQQQAIGAFGSFALAEENLQRVLDKAVATVSEVLDAPLVKVLEFAGTADRLLLRSGVGWKDGLVGSAWVGVDRESQAGFTLSQEAPVIVEDLQAETRFSGPPLLHEHGVRGGISVVVAGDEDRPFGVLGAHVRSPRRFDGADADFLLAIANIIANAARQQRINEGRRMVVREMAHRSGNMFQLVQSLYTQTMSRTADPAAAAESFRERLATLARANFILASGGWGDASIRKVIATALEAFAERFECSGRDIMLPSDLAFDLSLILHELATNSAKYGALSGDQGIIRVDWELKPAQAAPSLHLHWLDTAGGPRGAAPGTGFGARLISTLVERKWDGHIEVAQEDGYRMSIVLPLPHAK